jgi:UDP-N-acetylmuramate--alanine ligase
MTLPAPGVHSVLNALAAIAVALELKVDLKKIKDALDGFEGIQRRMELKGKAKGISFYDDYGHHPTEIRATLGAVKESMSKGRLVVVFQPHRYSRTKDLMDEFAASFKDADLLVVMDIYPAGEKPIRGVSSGVLIKKMNKSDVFYAAGNNEVVELLGGKLKSGDVVLTLGAGDVWKTGESLLKKMKAKK